MKATGVVRSLLFDMFEKLEVFVSHHRSVQENDGTVIELDSGVRDSSSWSEMLPWVDQFYRSLSQLAYDLFDLRQRLDVDDDEMATRQIDGLVTGLMDTVQTIDLFLGEDTERYVRWIEKRRELSIVVALVEVGDILKDQIFNRMKTCVLTSATLTVGGKFDFLKGRLSLEQTDLEVSLPSPFDFDRQMMILIPRDIAPPGHAHYVEDISAGALSIIEKTGGKAFVLFTSYRTLEEVHGRIGDWLREQGYTVFKQGSESRIKLLEGFKADIHSVLFGTVSFWEGVDAPGKTLQCVVITKLPFRVPTEPIIKARSEKILRHGGNPFHDYQVPLAVIKLRQGIGRLIRNREDRGIVAILDSRILVKSYGSLFIDSMPTAEVYRGALSEALDHAERFLRITP
jgi:ATP-dependent DNA helicase DinG